MTTFASFQQRPFSSTASLIGDALGSAASATQAAIQLPAGPSRVRWRTPFPPSRLPQSRHTSRLASDAGNNDAGNYLAEPSEFAASRHSAARYAGGAAGDERCRRIGMPFGEVFGLKEGKSLAPEINVRWKSVKADDILDAMGLDDDEAEFRDLAKALDLDNLRPPLFKLPPDERMDEEEFKLFTRKQKLSEAVSESLWRNLDVDGNGIVDADEFTMALETMTKARAWLRFCPTCDFANECPYCVECADCRGARPSASAHGIGMIIRQETVFDGGVER